MVWTPWNVGEVNTLSITVTCEKCGKKLKADEKYIGKKGRCPGCGETLLIEEPEGLWDRAKLDPAKAPPKEPEEAAEKAPEKKPDKPGMLMVEKFGDVGVVKFMTSRVLDGSNVAQLGDELDNLVTVQYITKLLVNFENVQYMSSAVLGKLITLHKKVKKEKGVLKFCSIDKSVLEIFEIMKLDKLFSIYETEEKALESFGKWFG